MTDVDTPGTAGTDFDPIAFLEEAVRTPSHEDVGPMRALLVETLEDHGISVGVDGAGNVVATRGDDHVSAADDGTGSAARGDGTHLLLNTHIDTVTPHVPFDRDGEDVLRGRGSCDAKGPLAALVAGFLAADLDRSDASSDRLTLLVTPDEELYSTGAHAFVDDADSPIRSVDGVIVGEPTGLDVCTAAKGRFEGTITITGANAHAAEPDSGTNAVAALESVLGALRTFHDRPDVTVDHSALGRATVTPTVVDGGDAVNQVPDECRLMIDRRSVPPETADGFRDDLLGHLREAAPPDVGVDFSFTDRPTPWLEAWATDLDEPLVETLQGAAGGEVRPFSAATEASYFADHAPTVVFGPGVLADDEGAVAHSPREYVRLGEVEQAAVAVTETLASLLA